MPAREIEFFARHRDLVKEWLSLEARVDELMRDAVTAGDSDRALRLVKADSGDEQVDFFLRNRQLITEWAAIQPMAATALHDELLAAARHSGFEVAGADAGWTSVRTHSNEADASAPTIATELAWRKRDLLTVGRGWPYPRIALWVDTERVPAEERKRLRSATQHAATPLGMTKTDGAWVHWRQLDGVSHSQDLQRYAASCMAAFSEASEQLIPLALQVLSEQASG